MKPITMKDKFRKLAFTLALPLVFAACNTASTGSTSSSNNSSSTETTSFPSTLAVASPLNYSSSSASSNALVQYSTSGSGSTSAYSSASSTIGSILSGSSSAVCSFDPNDFLQLEVDADCFGPQIAYQGHPDAGSGSDSGTLPTGDVGLWTDTDSTTGNACSAAQLNSRMESMEYKANAAIQALATMVCAATIGGKSMPDATTPTVDVLTEMNGLGIASTTFTTAEVNYDSSTGTYSYNLVMDYAPSATHHIVVDMQHTPGASDEEFAGTISYLVDDTFTGGNCPSSAVTHNGSIQYESVSANDVNLEVRNGMFCANGSDGRNSDNLVNPSEKYDATSNPTGWGNSFSIFTANFDPADMDGDYAYSWQAGPQDSNARVFNVMIENGGLDGDAFYGYGDDIASTDGSIEGFICNWAGPGASHSLVEYAQHQEVELDTATGAINVVTSNIQYAPTVSCDYDGTGSFVFDTDLDSDLTDEDATLAVANDMLAGDDLDGDAVVTIEEVIDDYGFVAPSM